ncbi:uncharacterized protein LOC134279410 isoform X2 [Saccostrea cucullata]|uniref:uncharacterized protein LOC134279410 isoform X2 n=1 Tax=Saccostrea cuccullata TaxID=36930 RepID=UPI002ED3058C
MPRDDKGRFIKESRQKQREGLARGREKSKARKSGTVNISETPEEALVGIDHNYFDGDNGGDDTCQIAKEVVLSQEDEEKKDQWRMGRRVVDLGIIADGLKSCQLCGQPLHLSNCVSERKFGLAHVLIVKCNFPECGLLNEVPTGRKHKTTSGGYAWDVNTKLAAAMINEGLGETQVNGLLASLNIPTITQKSLKEREREVGNQLDLMAEESCRQHLRREIEMSEGNLSASFDGAWQKRGTGRAYNSLTGHASLFGEKTKKLIGYSVMAKKCRICAAAKVKGVPPRKHKCRVNWTGSAKAMEPAMACQMLKNVEDEGVKVLVVKASVNPNISKKSDSNHTKKGFTGSLIELKRTSDILQIAAVSADQTFNVYMTPNRAIAEDASRATGLTYEGGVLKHHGQPLDAVEPARGLEQFVNFVRSLSKPFVIGHNIQNFDIPVLMFHLQKCNLMHVFQDSVSGFIDTYRLSKKVIDKATVCNYKQETLVKCLLGVDYEAHNALSDVTSLRKLYEEKLSKHCNSSDVFTLSYYSVKASLEPLVQKKVISALISKRLVNCSLSLNKLKLTHKRDPQNGIHNVFSEPMSSSKTPRISKSKNVINKVVEFMKTL